MFRGRQGWVARQYRISTLYSRQRPPASVSALIPELFFLCCWFSGTHRLCRMYVFPGDWLDHRTNRKDWLSGRPGFEPGDSPDSRRCWKDRSFFGPAIWPVVGYPDQARQLGWILNPVPGLDQNLPRLKCIHAQLLPLPLPLQKGNYPYSTLRQRAAGPRPLHWTAPADFCACRMRRTMSRLTPGHTCSSWVKVNSPAKPAIAAST